MEEGRKGGGGEGDLVRLRPCVVRWGCALHAMAIGRKEGNMNIKEERRKGRKEGREM